jgi:hypothetical protein
LTEGTVFGALVGTFEEPVDEVAAAGGVMLAADGAGLGAAAALLSGIVGVAGAALTVWVAPTAGVVAGVEVANGTAGPGAGGLTVGTVAAVGGAAATVAAGVVVGAVEGVAVAAVGAEAAVVCAAAGAGVVALAGCVAATAGVFGSGGFSASDFVGSAKRRSTKYSVFADSPASEPKNDESVCSFAP